MSARISVFTAFRTGGTKNHLSILHDGSHRLATDKDADGERQDYHPLLQRRKAA